MLRDYLRLVVFAFGLLIGVQLPGFVDQYAKRVSAHRIEAARNFEGFQRTADRYFNGNVEALLAHYAASPDAVFKDDAKNVAVIYARLKALTAELEAMQRPLASRIAHVALHPDREILDETIAEYSYTVPLNQAAILCGIIAGFSLALLADLLLLALWRLLPFRRPERSSA